MFEIIGRLSPQSKRTTNLRFNILNLHRQLGIQIGKARIVLEKALAPHSSTLAWKIPWTEEPGRLQSMGSLRVGHDWTTSLLLLTFLHWRRKWQPTPVFLPGESQGRGSLVGCPSMGLHRVGHDWSDLAAAFPAYAFKDQNCSASQMFWYIELSILFRSNTF